jgi:hypothetical protein
MKLAAALVVAPSNVRILHPCHHLRQHQKELRQEAEAAVVVVVVK